MIRRVAAPKINSQLIVVSFFLDGGDLSSIPIFGSGGVLTGRLPDIREQAKNVTSHVPAVDRAADQKNLKKSKTSLLTLLSL